MVTNWSNYERLVVCLCRWFGVAVGVGRLVLFGLVSLLQAAVDFGFAKQLFNWRVMKDLSKLTAVVYDYGLHTEIAVRLARDFGSVKYYAHWEDAFAKSRLRRVGEGLEGVERIHDFWAEVDNADMVYVPDSLCAGIVEHLKHIGIPTAGPGASEKFEQDRVFGRFDVQKAAGLPTQETTVIKGITKVREYLKKHKELFVKLNTSRGDRESFKHVDYEQTEPILDKLSFDLGPWKEDEEFILEEVLPGIEPGADSIVFGGEYLSPTLYGFEMKGGGYIGRVCDYKDLPKPLKVVNDKLLPYFKSNDTRCFFSTEIKLDKDGIPYLIDPTVRHAGPVGYSVQTELIENFSHVVYGLATGEKVQPKMKYKYCGGVSYNSDEARDNWMRIKFPPGMRRWIKLRMAAKVGNNYYAAPGFDNICTVIALSNFINEIPDMIKERTGAIQAQSIDKDMSGLDFLQEQIKEGKSYGINF